MESSAAGHVQLVAVVGLTVRESAGVPHHYRIKLQPFREIVRDHYKTAAIGAVFVCNEAWAERLELPVRLLGLPGAAADHRDRGASSATNLLQVLAYSLL
jgi:hypothetical protein